MHVNQLQEDLIIFSTVAGSHAYGTNNADSDIDIRGIYVNPINKILSFKQPEPQASDDKKDITYYELRRYMQLASRVNPNVIELLWMPNDCIRKITLPMHLLMANKNLFISTRAFHTFKGYAYQQIMKARGQNKWVNNKKDVNPPDKKDFCWVIKDFENRENGTMPVRPIPLQDDKFLFTFMEHFRAAKLEHVPNVYRIYNYSDMNDNKGFFRGKSQNLVVDSIPKEDEWKRFYGLLIYKEQDYDKSCTEWKNYWEWHKNRNVARYRDQENNIIDYDCKNLCHCARLLLSCKNILINGEPIVRFSGTELEFLMEIRNGKFKYEEIMSWTEASMNDLSIEYEKSSLPKSVDIGKIDQLYLDVVEAMYGSKDF